MSTYFRWTLIPAIHSQGRSRPSAYLLSEGDHKGHLETVTFVAASEGGNHKWWSVNVGTYERDFTKIVSPELAKDIANRLHRGETVEFPNRYELEQVQGGFGGCCETQLVDGRRARLLLLTRS